MNQCTGCQRNLPVHHGIHMAEFEMTRCERTKLTLEPIERDTWYQPGKRKREDAPFVVGGEV